MPVYEYQCKGCGHEFEREQRISEAPVKKCPSCGALKARRQISRTSFVLKGGGWYSDLYGAAKPAAAEKTETPASGESKPTAEPAKPTGSDGKTDGGGKSETSGKSPKKGGKAAKSAA